MPSGPPAVHLVFLVACVHTASHQQISTDLLSVLIRKELDSSAM